MADLTPERLAFYRRALATRGETQNPHIKELFDAYTAQAEEIVSLRAQLEESRKDWLYHYDCRPNRRQAEAAMADAKAVNDLNADLHVEIRNLKAQLAARPDASALVAAAEAFEPTK